ncbi:MAG: translocation/assembly module TamB [Deltaproteobacteria bacterium]|nr:translocation/assembly module TamB [Deltaproteobacteria bacterium]
MKKTPNRRRRRWFLALCALPILLLLTLGGSLIFLRSAAGERWVWAKIQAALMAQDLTLTAGSFAGPLPLTVQAQNIRLADPTGEFLTAATLDTRVSFWPLLRGTIKADLALAGVELARRPILKPSPENESAGGFPPLDLAITVSLADSRLAGAALTPDNPGAGALVNLTGQVVLQDESLTFQAAGSLLDEEGRGLSLQGSLGSGRPGGPENLELALTFKDLDGRLTGPRPDLPRELTLTLTGQGPLTDWAGQARLTARDPGPNQKALAAPGAEMALAEVDLRFQGKTGQLLQDLTQKPDFRLAVDLWALALLAPPASRPSPPRLGPWPGESRVSLKAQVAKVGEEIAGELAWSSPWLTGQAQKISLLQTEASLTAALTGTLSPGPLWELPPTELSLDLALQKVAERTELTKLQLSGPGLELVAAGQMENSPAPTKPSPTTLTETPTEIEPKIHLRAQLKTAAESSLNGLLNKLAPQVPWPGQLALNLELDRSTAGTLAATGQLELADLGRLVPDWGGSLATQYQVKGLLNDFDLQLSLQSPELKNPASPFRDLGLDLTGHYQESPDSRTVTVQLAAAAQAPGAPLKLTAQARLASQPDRLALELAGFDLTAPGVRAQSQELRLALEPKKPPELSGSLLAEIQDWAQLGQLLGQDLQGSPATLNIQVAKNQPPTAEVTVAIPALRVGETLALSRLSLHLNSLLSDQAQLDLKLTQGPGRVGPVAFQGGEVSLTGAGLWSEGLAGEVKTLLAGPTGGELLRLEAAYDLKARLVKLRRLLAAPPWIQGTVTLQQELALDLSQGIKFANLALGLSAGGRLSLSGEMGQEIPLKAQLKIEDLALDILSPDLAALPKGRLNLQADYQQGVGGSFDLKSSLVGPPILNLAASGQLSQNVLKGQAQVAWPNGTRPVKATFQLPTQPLGRLVAPALGGSFTAEAGWRGPAGQLWSLTGLEDMALKGEVDLQARARGSLSQPKTELTLYLAQGSFQDPATGLTLTGLNLSGVMDERGEIKLLAAASDGGQGQLALEGTVNPRALPPSLKARAQLDRLSPLRRDDLSLTLSALATLEGPFNALRLTAQAIVESAEVSLAQGFGGPPVKTLELSQGQDKSEKSSPLALDLTIDIPRKFFIRGRGLDSEWQGQLRLQGAASSPVISGHIKPVRGYLELLSKQFTISTNGDINFFESASLNPTLSLELTRQASEVLAVIRVAGTKDAPRISLESQPPLPPDEVLAQILFGKKTSQLSRVETLQLANSLKSLTGLGPKMDLLAPLNAVRDTLGLSVLRFGESTSGSDNRILQSNSFRDNLSLDDDNEPMTSSATIEAGKYINDRVYVGVEQNLGQNTTGVRLEVELTPNLSLESKTTTQSSRVGLGWKKDY